MSVKALWNDFPSNRLPPNVAFTPFPANRALKVDSCESLGV